MVKRTVNMPDEDPSEKSYPVVPVGEHKFRIIDVLPTDDVDTVSCKLEVISDSAKEMSMLHRTSISEKNKFFWLTRLLLKCIGEPCRGNVEIDTDAWIGRTFTGRVEHSGKYANIREFIYKDEPQVPSKEQHNGKDIQW